MRLRKSSGSFPVMKTLAIVAIAAPLVLVGCMQDPGGDTSRYDLVADVPTMMNGILEPAAETYWDAVGTIIDFDGIHEFRPETDEEWEQVRHAAYVLAESGNLLMMDGRAIDRSAWMGFSQDMIDVGRVAIAAAESRDFDRVFDAGAEVYAVCSACHASYALETLRPSDDRADDTPEDQSGG